MESFSHYIDGEWVDGDETFRSTNPATGEPIAGFPRGREAEVDRAIEATHSTNRRSWDR